MRLDLLLLGAQITTHSQEKLHRTLLRARCSFQCLGQAMKKLLPPAHHFISSLRPAPGCPSTTSCVCYLRNHHSTMPGQRRTATNTNAEKGPGDPLELKRLAKRDARLNKVGWEMGTSLGTREIQHTEAWAAL